MSPQPPRREVAILAALNRCLESNYSMRRAASFEHVTHWTIKHHYPFPQQTRENVVAAFSSALALIRISFDISTKNLSACSLFYNHWHEVSCHRIACLIPPACQGVEPPRCSAPLCRVCSSSLNDSPHSVSSEHPKLAVRCGNKGRYEEEEKGKTRVAAHASRGRKRAT